MTTEPRRFRVELAGQAHSALMRLAGCAEQRGLRQLLLETVRQMIENLEARPREWGDPYTNYRGLNAVGYEQTILPAGLRVKYAVHETEPVVWLAMIRTLSGSPFA